MKDTSEHEPACNGWRDIPVMGCPFTPKSSTSFYSPRLGNSMAKRPKELHSSTVVRVIAPALAYGMMT